MSLRPFLPTALACVLLSGCGSRPVSAGPATTTRVTTGLYRPVFVTSPPADSSRLFIVEQSTGSIRVFRNGSLLARPFLTIPGLASGNEQGLLGLAFHPQYASNGYFYVHCTPANGSVAIRRYHVSSNPDRADSVSGVTLLNISHPQSNHNGGWIAFGPDGFLYDGLGDGGNGGDTGSGHDPLTGNAQSDTTRLGKILRLDVDGGFPYAIPPDNPWHASPSPRNEFWAKGVRNPWRNSFDRATGDLYIGDVGQNLWEEIDYQPAGAGGRNYGWRKFEGYSIYNCPGPCDSSGLTRPVYSYSHSGSPGGCSVTGGYVYRGSAIPSMQGTYFFSDFCSGKVLSFRIAGGAVTQFTDRTAELAPSTGSLAGITSFGEDARGELYIVTQGSGGPDGAVFKIVPAGPAGAGDGVRKPAALFLDHPQPNPAARGVSVRLELPGEARVRAAMYDTMGRLVRLLHDGTWAAGGHTLAWDGRDQRGAAVPTGVYLVKVESGDGSRSVKVAWVR
jgi:glucose/arabinose dehydrogenase